MIQSILEAKKNFTHRAYRMNRCTNYCGRFIRHGLWYPDRKVRLFDRHVAEWGGLNPHDKIILNPGFELTHLPGDILHYSFDIPDDLVWQNNRLSSIAANSLYSSRRRSSWIKMLLNPAWAFLNGYILRLGFLDGVEGFTIAINTSHQVFLKYNKLYRLQQLRKKQVSPDITRQFLAEKKSVASDG